MRQRRIKTADVCDLTGYQRDELNYVLRDVPACTITRVSSKASREFTPLNLLTLCVVYVLDRKYGLRLKAIVQIYDQLYHALAQPRSVNDGARLIISIDPPIVTYAESPKCGDTGIVIEMKDIFTRIDHFCSAFHIEGQPFQMTLAFGPSLVDAGYAERQEINNDRVILSTSTKS